MKAPGLRRRLVCFLYEGVLLFGVVMVTGLIYAGITQQRNALVGKTGLQVTLFIVLGAYFVGFWASVGQTLPMQIWHIKLVDRDGGPVSVARASARYVLAWLWFVPALAAVHFSGLENASATFAAMAAGVLVYAALGRLRPDRQYWHDAACGTRLVNMPARPPRPAQGAPAAPPGP
ncbi:MAG: RDD family protein [Burkholderiales bacterium]|nr:RDD family protein [Burkholderiales bacterium]MDE2276680.1 RDD family protein [Burkholderiales bacterium]